MDVKPGYKQTEVGEIPEDWDAKPLAGLAVIIHGFGFQGQYFKPSGDYRLTTPGHFYETGGFRDVGDKQKFYEGPLPDGYLLNEGDLLVVMTEQADGLLGSAAFVPTGGTYLHNQRLGKIKVLSSEISIGFLYCVFNSESYRAKVRETAAGTKVKHTSPSKLLEISISLPPTRVEQDAIAAALSDVDALIAALDRLIAKKRDIKQAAMQELLTGKRRLPGFHKAWIKVRLRDLLRVRHGKSQHEIIVSNGQYPILATGGEIGRTNNFLYDKPSVLIGRKGTIDSPQYIETPFWTIDTLFYTEIDEHCTPRFIFYKFCMIDWMHYNEASGVPSLNASTIENIEIDSPNLNEQTAIAAILSDMDAEIAALEARRNKTRALKQGMMQELLTGRIRLV